MKKVGLLLLVIAGIAVLVYGKMHWKGQIVAMTDESRVTNESRESRENDSQEVNLDYAENLPQEIIDKLANGETVSLTLIARNQEDWALGLKDALREAYGRGVWDVSILTYDEYTTADIVQDERFQNLQTDMIAYEVPLLNDNLSVDVNFDLTFEETQNLLNAWSESVIILQPSNPVHLGINYPLQVETFGENMINLGYTYLNHWQAWPDFRSDDIVPYLNEDGMRPSEAGAALWLEYISRHFIAR